MSSNQEYWSPTKSRHVDARTMEEVDKLSGRDFEFFAADLLRFQGYKIVKVTPASGDLGTDIIAERGGTRYSVQVKCWSRWVSPDAVREAQHGKDAYKCHATMVIANRKFMPETRLLAKQFSCALIDRSILAEWVAAYARQKAQLDAVRARDQKAIAPASSVTFRVGDRVQHPTFGKGQVVSTLPKGEDQIVTVEFKGEAGIRTLLARQVRLEKLSSTR